MKCCTKCNEIKEESLFPRNKRSSDGFGSWCKSCVAKNSAAYFKTERGREVLRKAQTRYFGSEKGKATLKRGIKKQAEAGYYRFGKGAIPILRQGAKVRGISFGLTAETLESWWHSVPDSCVYCGISIEEYRILRDFILGYTGDNSTIKRFLRFFRSPKHAAINWMTIDRINNGIGYEISNIVKCCWFCNSLKSDFFSPEEMRSFSPLIMERLKKAINQTDKPSAL
jgi:hypothetical protein